MSRNKHQDEGFEQDPHGWYCEDRPPVEQLFDALDFGVGNLVFDPSCGRGNILDVAKSRGHATVGCDIVDRHPRHHFFRGNFLWATRYPNSGARRLIVMNNPPYNADTGTAISFILKVLDEVPFWRAAFLVPIEFLAAQDRYRDLFSKHPPSHVAICSQRPSMPPGEMIDDLGDKAFKGGKADFVWIVWTAGGPYRTETIFLKPDALKRPETHGRKRRT